MLPVSALATLMQLHFPRASADAFSFIWEFIHCSDKGFL